MFTRTKLRTACPLWAAALLFLPTGCAKSPAGTASGTGPQLIVSMTVAGRIRPDYSYFVLFNNANDTSGTNGPIPVVSTPWGNGFATGRTAGAGLTHFVRFDTSQPQGGYGVYAIVPGSNLRTSQYLGAPLQVATGSNTLQFRIPLSQLATTAVPAGSVRSLQINFLATNTIPLDPNYGGTKFFDALGDARQPGGVNNYITISTAQSAIYQNSDKALEPTGDVTEAGNGVFRTVSEPDLDITDFRVEVRD